MRELEQRRVPVFERPEDLLNLDIEAVWLPLPIHLHRRYTELALAAGKAVMTEKPAAGCVQDLDAMMAASVAARLPVAVGFQHLYAPSTHLLKRMILDGAIGRVWQAKLMACWPRDGSYYARSWAGRQMVDGVWVLDSPAMNALSHYINLALFLMGRTPETPAVPARVQAELYRANPIENYDTCGLRITTDDGATLLVLLTHAGEVEEGPALHIGGESGQIVYHPPDAALVVGNGRVHDIPLPREPHVDMVNRFARFVRGAASPNPPATLEMARAHLVAINGASEAAVVRPVPAEMLQHSTRSNGAGLVAIRGVEELFRYCWQENRLPHESGRAEWTQPAGERDLVGYSHFRGSAGA